MRRLSLAIAFLVAGATGGAISKGNSTTAHREVAVVGAFCSGVAVGPQTVLTSWHCNGATYVAIDGYARKNHTVVQLGGIDLAYVCLAVPQTMTVATATTTALSDGANVTVAGYGEREKLTYAEMFLRRSKLAAQMNDETFDAGVFMAGAGGGGGLLREGSSRISMSAAAPLLNPNPAVPCMGDSGGPVYSPGTLSLIGIIDEYPPPSEGAVCGSAMRYLDLTSRSHLIAEAKRACGDP